MRYSGFVGPANALQSPLADAERLVNWYVEGTQSDAAPTGAVLLPTPGTRTFATTTETGTRALYNTGARQFAVIGPGFYELFADGTTTRHGTVAVDANPATISANGVTGGQLFITSGGNGYLFTLASNTLSAIPTLFAEATMGGAKDGFFLAFNRTLGRVRISDLYDGATWDPLQFFQNSLSPAPWVAMVVGNPEVWLLSEVDGQCWFNSGAYPQPFAPMSGAFFQTGTRAPFSARLSGDALVWLANTADGPGRIVRATGYTPTPLSGYAVDTAIGAYLRDGVATDAETLVYEEDGHTFACVTFPSAPATWCVDLTSGLWHQRGTWNDVEHRYDVWRPRVAMNAYGKTIVGDRSSGVLSVSDVSIGSESDGTLVRRQRIGPPIWARHNRRLVMSRFELNLDTGVGLANGAGSSPAAFLRSSWDTRSWQAQTQRGTGAIGQFGTRVVWTRLGSSDKAWMPEVTVADATPWRVSGAEIDGSGFAEAA